MYNSVTRFLRQTARSRVAATLALVGILASGGACLVNTRSNTRYVCGRAPVPSSVAREIRVGVTTKEWILENLGAPSSTDAIDGSGEVLHYVSTEKKTGKLSVFVIGSFEEDKERSESFFVTLRDGIVTDFGRRRY